MVKENLQKLNIFNYNDYFYKYVDLIERNLLTKKSKNITQRHHIIPRYYFKHNNLKVDNSCNNIVNLDYKEHILAHYYLSLCSIDEKDKLSNVSAICRISSKTIKEIKENLDSLEMYDELYKEYQVHNSMTHKGKTHTTSQETRDKISIANKNNCKNYVHIYFDDTNEKIVSRDLLDLYLQEGWNIGRCQKSKDNLKTNYNYNSKGMLGKSQSDYQKQRVSESLKGVKKSNEARTNMSKARLNKVLYSNDILNVSKYIAKEEIEVYENLGYHKGKLKK